MLGSLFYRILRTETAAEKLALRIRFEKETKGNSEMFKICKIYLAIGE